MTIWEKFRGLIVKISLVLRTLKNWPVFAMNYWHIFPKGRLMRLELWGGKKMYVRSGTPDSEVVVNVYSGYDYPLDFLRQSISNHSTVLDVGANIGTFTVYVKKHFPQARIYAFEPDPENFHILELNIELNELKNVRSLPKAVYNRVGTIRFDNQTDNTGAYAVSRTGHLLVPTTDLDTFIKKEKLSKIDLLKMDCEGSEYAIIESFKNIEICHHIILEYHLFNQPDPKKHDDQFIINHLKNSGFALVYADRKYDVMGTLYFTRKP